MFSQDGRVLGTTNSVSAQECSLTVAGPWLWNSFPTALCRSDMVLVKFKRLLTTHLIRVAETASHLMTVMLLHHV